MTDRKKPSESAPDADRQQFDAQLQQARQELAGKDEGAAAGRGPGGLWSFLAGALSDPAVRDLLWSLFRRWKGGTTEPTPQPPAPPPEPTS